MSMRRIITFDRFLQRVFEQFGKGVVLKGGYAMELRLPIARTTKDIDLSLTDISLYSKSRSEQNESMFESLVKACRLDLGDFFAFEVSGPVMELDAPYGGARFNVKATVAAKEFANFHVDLAIGDATVSPIEVSKPEQFLEFAGIQTSDYRLIPREQHFAEKLHAYTRTDLKHNTRVKDLVDMVLLIKSGMNTKRLRTAIQKTFERRSSHSLPKTLKAPPEIWERPYKELATRCKITTNIEEAFDYVDSYFKDYISDLPD